MRGKAQYSLPPCTNYFRSDPFDNTNIIYFHTKQTTLMRRPTIQRLQLHKVLPVQGNKASEATHGSQADQIFQVITNSITLTKLLSDLFNSSF